jgi:hypothetical protein
MKIYSQRRYRILWYEGAGFLLLVVMSWFDEYHSSWKESAIESGMVLVVWLAVHLFTRRLISHLHYLEGFLRVCAWCKKVEHEESWIPLEQFLETGLDTKATHGMCPACAAQFKAGLKS